MIATKPNIKLFMKVCDTILKHPRQFSMRSFDCGTTACIAGWALRLTGTPFGTPVGDGHSVYSKEACEALGIAGWQGDVLFYEMDIDTPEQAVKFIHKCLDEWYPSWREEKGTL